MILYAPTWREDQPKKGGRYGLDLRLDLAQAAEELAQDHVLLVRRHYLVGGTVPGAGRGAADFVRDVSRHPDVAELMLISDALVTDYSSLMFDFAQTGRPMYFHAYDLEHYRDTLRGLLRLRVRGARTGRDRHRRARGRPAGPRVPGAHRRVRTVPGDLLRSGRRHRRRPPRGPDARGGGA